MRGGWGPHLPRPIEQMLFCLVFVPALLMLHPALAVLGYAAAVIATLKGHGRNMDLGHYTGAAKPEWYELTFLHGKMNEYWYDVINIGISGFTYTAVPGLLYATYNPVMGVLMALSGFLKFPAYMIGWALHPEGNNGPQLPMMKNATEVGEFLTGVFIWGAVISTYGV